jgi:UDP-N-acetylmuramoylalanine--D-glutamate ligase
MAMGMHAASYDVGPGGDRTHAKTGATPLPSFNVAGCRVVVVGAARSGVAAAELLVSRGAHVTLSDLRDAIDDGDRLTRIGVHLELGRHGTETFAAADLIVLSPGVPMTQPAIAAARARGVPVIGDVELASRWLKGRVVAITGTKGKSTTTTLTGQLLQSAGFHTLVGGNIGVPLCAQVDLSTPETLHVVETSSFQLEQTETFRPWIAVLLNLSPDHLDRHPDISSYRAAKARIFTQQTPDDWTVINADDPSVLEMVASSRARIRAFALQAPLAEGVVVSKGWIVDRGPGGDRPLVPLDAVHLPGAHLLADVLAAVSVGVVAGATPAAMVRAVDAFRGLEHAMELVAEAGGIRFVNDSKATNIEAATRAIESVGPGAVPIIGGRFKGGDLRLLRDAVAANVTAVVVIGEARPLVREALGDLVAVHDAESMDEAVSTAVRLVRPPGVVLLAPACSSFDMFADYADRGRRFKDAVRTELAKAGR